MGTDFPYIEGLSQGFGLFRKADADPVLGCKAVVGDRRQHSLARYCTVCILPVCSLQSFPQ